AILDFAAWVGGNREQRGDLQCNRIDLARKQNIVVRNRGWQVDLSCLARRSKDGLKVSVQNVASRNICSIGCGSRPLDGSLIALEKEQLILDDGAAHDAPVLVSLQRVANRREEVPRIHGAVSHEPESVTVYRIRSRLRDRVDCSTGMTSVICRKRACFDFEFLKGIGKRKR